MSPSLPPLTKSATFTCAICDAVENDTGISLITSHHHMTRKEYMRLYRLKNRSKLTAQRRAWLTPEKQAEYYAKYYPQKQESKRRRYRAREDVRQYDKDRVKRWAAANPDKKRDSGIRRVLAASLQCLPSEIPQEFIALNRAHLTLKSELAKFK